MIVPVTNLSSYLYCKRKLFLEQALKLCEVPKQSIIKGRIKHQIYDRINKSEKQLVISIKKYKNLEEIKGLFKRNYYNILKEIIASNKRDLKKVNLDSELLLKQIYPLIINESDSRALNIHNFIEKKNIFGIKLWEILIPKIESEVNVKSENLKLKGVIDKIKKYKDQVVPVELKTGRMPVEGVWKNHQVQISAYSILLRDKLKFTVKEAVIKYLDYNTERIIRLNPFLEKEVIGLRDKVISLLNTREIPDFCSNLNKCKICGLYKICQNKKLLLDKLSNM